MTPPAGAGGSDPVPQESSLTVPSLPECASREAVCGAGETPPRPPPTARARPGGLRLRVGWGRARGGGRLTLTLRWCTREGWHLTLLVVQQPVQRLTSTHGGQIRKLADVGSTWLRGIS